MDRLVLCIHRQNSPLPSQRLSHIGGVHPDGKHWRLSLPEAIDEVESGRQRFLVLAGNEVVDVRVAHGSAGEKYLKSAVDGDQPESLLNLPDCR